MWSLVYLEAQSFVRPQNPLAALSLPVLEDPSLFDGERVHQEASLANMRAVADNATTGWDERLLQRCSDLRDWSNGGVCVSAARTIAGAVC